MLLETMPSSRQSTTLRPRNQKASLTDQSTSGSSSETSKDPDDKYCHEKDTLLVRGGNEHFLSSTSTTKRVWEVVKEYWYLGLISFGGPPAHVALLREVLTVQKKWLTEEVFLELFSVAQGLPGPSSTQLVIATAISHAGILGGVVAWICWCVPSASLLSLAGVALVQHQGKSSPFWMRGIPPAALALTLKAGYKFVNTLDSLQQVLATISCMVAILINSDLRIPRTSAQFVYPSLLAMAGMATLLAKQTDATRTSLSSSKSSALLKTKQTAPPQNMLDHLPLWTGALAFGIWIVLFLVASFLPFTSPLFRLFAINFRTGSIIFGGGPVIVPLLAAELVPETIPGDLFYNGVGLTQSLPGPFFNFSAYLGALQAGWKGALAANLGLFSPGFILLVAALPFWSQLRHSASFRKILRGVNAAAIGLIGSACVNIYSSSIKRGADSIVLVFTSSPVSFSNNLPSPLIIFLGAVLGAILSILQLGQKAYG